MTDYFKYTTRKLTEEESHELINRLFDENARLKVESDRRRDNFNEMCDKYRELEKKHEDLQKRQNACADTWVKYEDRIDTLNGTLEAKNEEIGRLREKNDNQRIQLIGVQQALADKNIQVEELKKEVKERRVVFEPTSYQRDIKAKDDEIKTLRKENLDLKNANEVLGLKLASHTQPLYIENLNVTYYANGPIWTNEEDEDDIPGSVE